MYVKVFVFFKNTTLPHGCQGFPAQSNGTPTQTNASKRKQTEVKAGKSQQTQAKASQILFGICFKCLKKKRASRSHAKTGLFFVFCSQKRSRFSTSFFLILTSILSSFWRHFGENMRKKTSSKTGPVLGDLKARKNAPLSSRCQGFAFTGPKSHPKWK